MSVEPSPDVEQTTVPITASPKPTANGSHPPVPPDVSVDHEAPPASPDHEAAPHAHEAPRDERFADGLRLAATMFTIAPVRVAVPNSASARATEPNSDHASTRIAMTVAPAIGVVLGLALGGIAIGLQAIGSPPIVTGLITIAVLATLTGGRPLEGLAETVDGLRSKQPSLNRPNVGALGVVALILTITVPAACIAAMWSRPWWSVLSALAAACAAGRLAAGFACRRGVPAASSDVTVAGTVGAVELAYGLVATAAIGLLAVPGRLWQGPTAVLVGLAATVALVWYVQRRLGGITVDTLGACIELATAITLIGVVLV